MSDKLVVEFYNDDSFPIAAVLVLHGGDNPHSASLTMASFLVGIRAKARMEGFDAYDVVTRFLLHSCAREEDMGADAAPEAFLIPISPAYTYQLCRIYIENGVFRATAVVDQYCTEEETEEAKGVWESVGIPVEFREIYHPRTVADR